MALYCKYCETVLENDIKFCPSCHKQVQTINKEPTNTDSDFQQQTSTYEMGKDISHMDETDLKVGVTSHEKGMAILAYLSVLVFIPMVFSRDSQFVRFHVNQGIVNLCASAVYSMFYSLMTEFVLSFLGAGLLSIPLWILGGIFYLFAFFGVMNASSEKMRELPLIGGIKILR